MKQRAAVRCRSLHPASQGPREASILNKKLQAGEKDIPTFGSAHDLRQSSTSVSLKETAGMSVLAHLEDLVARGQVATPTVRRPSRGAIAGWLSAGFPGRGEGFLGPGFTGRFAFSSAVVTRRSSSMSLSRLTIREAVLKS